MKNCAGCDMSRKDNRKAMSIKKQGYGAKNMEHKQRKGSAKIVAVLTILIVVGSGYGIYSYTQKRAVLRQERLEQQRLEQAERARRIGKIKFIGFSFHDEYDVFTSIIDGYNKWDFCQIQYNYMDENYQAGRAGLHKAHEKGLPVIIMEPLLGGKLANGLPAKALQLFKKAEPDRSAASWALRWLWDQPEVTVVLSGMNSAEQLADNIKTAGNAKHGMLSEQEASVFTPVIAALRETYKVPCTGCNYCMPCPQEVNIPGCFAAYNASFAMGFVSGIMQYIMSTCANRPDKQYRAINCVGCGSCEKKCPQHIEISKTLGVVAKKMEPFWFKALVWLMHKIMS